MRTLFAQFLEDTIDEMHTQFARAFAHLAPNNVATNIPLTKNRTSAVVSTVHVQLMQSIAAPNTSAVAPTSSFADSPRHHHSHHHCHRSNHHHQHRSSIPPFSPAISAIDDDVLVTTLHVGGLSASISTDKTLATSPESTV
jgi:hypothetical protein